MAAPLGRKWQLLSLGTAFIFSQSAFAMLNRKEVDRNGYSITIPFLDSQQLTITGTVKNTKNQPLAGVTILAKNGTGTGTSTDENGKFSLGAAVGTTLIVKYVGYKEREVSVSDSRLLSIQLEEDVTAMDEVVVVGFGSQKKVNLTGAVATVKEMIW